MADEVHYGSSDSNKRKYDDNQTPPAPRRQTGFSAPISSHSPPDSSLGHQAPPSYNSVPPPMDEIQLAKQKAQEIAARLFNNAEATKRPRVENGGGGGGGGGGSGFDSMERECFFLWFLFSYLFITSFCFVWWFGVLIYFFYLFYI